MTFPDWITSRWNRHVTKQLCQRGEYPTIKEFSEFMEQEAEIAGNPMTPLDALKPAKEKPSRDVNRPQVNTFITGIKATVKE